MLKIQGLLPDTSHLVTITAQIPNHTNDTSSNYAASVEFRTLTSRTLSIPQDLCIEKDPNELDTLIVSWQPVVNMPNTISNGIAVGGYSIYLDGIRVHQILNPIASSVSLSSKLLFNGAKLLTVRTLSLDGNAESKDSEAIKLTKSLIIENRSDLSIEENRKKTQKILKDPLVSQSNAVNHSLNDNFSSPKKQPIQTITEPKSNLVQTTPNNTNNSVNSIFEEKVKFI